MNNWLFILIIAVLCNSESILIACNTYPKQELYVKAYVVDYVDFGVSLPSMTFGDLELWGPWPLVTLIFVQLTWFFRLAWFVRSTWFVPVDIIFPVYLICTPCLISLVYLICPVDMICPLTWFDRICAVDLIWLSCPVNMIGLTVWSYDKVYDCPTAAQRFCWILIYA